MRAAATTTGGRAAAALQHTESGGAARGARVFATSGMTTVALTADFATVLLPSPSTSPPPPPRLFSHHGPAQAKPPPHTHPPPSSPPLPIRLPIAAIEPPGLGPARPQCGARPGPAPVRRARCRSHCSQCHAVARRRHCGTPSQVRGARRASISTVRCDHRSADCCCPEHSGDRRSDAPRRQLRGGCIAAHPVRRARSRRRRPQSSVRAAASIAAGRAAAALNRVGCRATESSSTGGRTTGQQVAKRQEQHDRRQHNC